MNKAWQSIHNNIMEVNTEYYWLPLGQPGSDKEDLPAPLNTKEQVSKCDQFTCPPVSNRRCLNADVCTSPAQRVYLVVELSKQTFSQNRTAQLKTSTTATDNRMLPTTLPQTTHATQPSTTNKYTHTYVITCTHTYVHTVLIHTNTCMHLQTHTISCTHTYVRTYVHCTLLYLACVV